MPDYQKGKIYKLWSPQGNEIYIGSTINPLAKRLGHHKSQIVIVILNIYLKTMMLLKLN
jgi:predicted GIY-YIG superfamily endonuclease